MGKKVQAKGGTAMRTMKIKYQDENSDIIAQKKQARANLLYNKLFGKGK